MQRTAVAVAFVCLGLSFFAFVLQNNAPSSSADDQAPLLKDESALIQKEVTIHRSSAMEQEQDAGMAVEQAEDMASELFAFEDDNPRPEGHVVEQDVMNEKWKKYYEARMPNKALVHAPKGLQNASAYHDRDLVPTVSTKYLKNGNQIARTAWTSAWEIEDATQDYLKAMDNMSKLISDTMVNKGATYYSKYITKVVGKMKVLVGSTSYNWMDVAHYGVNATSFGPECGEQLNQTKTLMNNMAKDAKTSMVDAGEVITQMNKQYVPGTGMGFVEEQMGGWRELCPAIKEPMLDTLDKLNRVVDQYKEHSIELMNGIDENMQNYPADFQPQIEQFNVFIDRMLGLNINVFLKLQDDLYVGIESLALKFRICNHPTNKPLHQVQKDTRRGSLMHRPEPKQSGASSLGFGIAAAAAVVTSLM